jgi:hypothetical protein
MGIELLAGSLIAGAAAMKANRDRKKVLEEQKRQAAADLALRKQLASKVTAPTIKEEAQVELESEEALEDASILGKGKKQRLKVPRNVGGLASTGGTGLSVG